MGVGITHRNTVQNLANHYRETGQIRPDALPLLTPSKEKPEAVDYEGLMDTVTQMAQSPENLYTYRPGANEQHVRITSPEVKTERFDTIRANYSGSAQSGEIHLKDELGAFQTPERRTIEQEVFFAPDSIVAFNRTSNQGLTIDFIDRHDPSASSRFEIPAGTEWLTR